MPEEVNLASFLPQGTVIRSLLKSLSEGTYVHAYLISGAPGFGKRTLADICARALCCESGGERPCDVCPSCKQFLSGNHPDFIRVKPEKSIGVDAVRDVIERLSVKPYEAEAALKAKGLTDERARLLVRLSQGSVGKALEMDASEGFWQLRDKVLASLTSLHEKQDVGVAALPLAEKRDQASDILDILELCARDLMVIQDADGSVIQTDIEDKLRQQRFMGSKMLQNVMEARKMLSSNVAWQSVLEMLFFKMVGG